MNFSVLLLLVIISPLYIFLLIGYLYCFCNVIYYGLIKKDED